MTLPTRLQSHRAYLAGEPREQTHGQTLLVARELMAIVDELLGPRLDVGKLGEREWLQADIGALEGILERLPASNILERLTLESRLKRQREALRVASEEQP